MPREKILIVDDDEFMREGLVESLSRPGFEIKSFARAEEALEEAADGSASLLLTDMRLPGMNGIELVERVKRLDPKLPVVMMTAYATVESAVAAMKKGAFDYLIKPFKAEEIEVVVERALEHRRILTENEYLKGELSKRFTMSDFVGESPVMREIFDRIRQVAPSNATVLIRGESGTGKELVARAIHLQSPRRDKPLVRVNCAALSAGVLESELFGHERGAFTGADRRRIGRFEMAEGGTIFLDEVSEMDLTLQGKLLRVLQEKEFERVGSSETLTADVRVVASSNRNLEEAIEKGTFRHDLYYRLNVISIHLPPLRERRSDIRPLVAYFLEKHNREEGTHVRTITEEAMELLERYDWPGNVRELENIIERAIVLSRGDTIDASLIAPALSGAPGRPESAPPPFAPRPLEEVEREHILRTLAHFKGHRLRTAQALGISERSLRDRLSRWKEEGLLSSPDL